MERLRVLINAEFAPDLKPGGVQSVIIGLARSLGELVDGNEEYLLVVHPENRAWLEPHTSERVKLIERPQRKAAARDALHRPIRRYLKRYIDPSPRRWPEVPISKGFYESLGARVIHFPFQDFTVCGLPAIYNPHDVLHAHYPQFFEAWELAYREEMYSTACRMSQVVVAGTEWVRRDIIDHFGVAEAKVRVIPGASPTGFAQPASEAAIEAERRVLGFAAPFCYYPAVTWSHKNHIRLLEALAKLRDRGHVIPLASTGHLWEPEWSKISTAIDRLGLREQTAFLGQVPFDRINAIYGAAQFIVFPTLFEGLPSPLFEAWHAGKALTCSNATSLPEVAGDAAHFFDPLSIESICEALLRLSSDEALRQDLASRGRRRLEDFSWERTARAYRALYRQLAGEAISGEESELLRWNWMRDRASEQQVKL